MVTFIIALVVVFGLAVIAFALFRRPGRRLMVQGLSHLSILAAKILRIITTSQAARIRVEMMATGITADLTRGGGHH